MNSSQEDVSKNLPAPLQRATVRKSIPVVRLLIRKIPPSANAVTNSSFAPTSIAHSGEQLLMWICCRRILVGN
jgi:hypothetical protein